MLALSYNLGIYPVVNGTVARLSQYDSDFTITFALYTAYGTFTLESGTTAYIRGTKADGNGYSASCTLDVANKTVTVTGDEQITAAAGDNTFEIRLVKDDKILNTANFTIWVERAALDMGTITSESILYDLEAIVDSVSTATQAAEDAAASAEAAATSAATLELDDTLTQSGESADAKVVGDALRSGLAPAYDSSSPYAAGDYFLKDNILYHATAAIAAGATITVGTNVEIVPLGNAVAAINNNTTPVSLSLTYTSNSYVSETDFKRLRVFKIGSLYVCNGNFSITNDMPTATSNVAIGTISGWSSTHPINIDVPMQNGSGVAYISISTSGAVTLTNLSGTTIKGWCRFNASTM